MAENNPLPTTLPGFEHVNRYWDKRMGLPAAKIMPGEFYVSKSGEMNGYGLVGGMANAIEPNKRMLSSMSPTFIEDESRVAVLGTPGGSRIISMVLLAILDFAEGHGPESWIMLPRFHHQYVPDLIQYEKDGMTNDEIEALTRLGHKTKEIKYRYGNMQAIQFNKNTQQLTVASDPRGEGLALVK